jgi:hypothetical protein
MRAEALAGAIALDVPHFYQKENEWCWAACTQMIAAFLHKPDVQQCELANFLQGRNDCCQSPDSEACNQPCPLQNIVPVYNHLGIQATFDTHAETPAVMLQELSAGRPFEVGLLWLGGGGHVIIVHGMDEDGNYDVNDPWYGPGPVTYLGLLTAYGQGRWGVTYGVFR